MGVGQWSTLNRAYQTGVCSGLSATHCCRGCWINPWLRRAQSLQKMLTLPSMKQLSLESAEFLGKVDAVANARMHILLIADDQIIPSINMQTLQASATLAEERAQMISQEYHVKPNKTADLPMGQAAHDAEYCAAPVYLSGRPVPCVTTREW